MGRPNQERGAFSPETRTECAPSGVAYLLGLAQDAVDLATGVVDDVDDALLLFGGARERGLPDCAHECDDGAAEVDGRGVGTFGDLVPRRGLDLLGRGAAGIGELEQLLAAAVTLGADDQVLVDQQLQGRVDRAGAGLPQILAALGDLLDHLVAVHRPLGEQRQDGCADVATLAAAPSAAAATWAAATATETRSESGAAESTTEAGTAEAWSETGTERAVMAAAVVLADRFAEPAACGAAMFVDGATVDGCEPEAEAACVGPTLEGAAGGCEWGVHVISPSAGNAECASDTLTIYRKLSRCNQNLERTSAARGTTARRWP